MAIGSTIIIIQFLGISNYDVVGHAASKAQQELLALAMKRYPIMKWWCIVASRIINFKDEAARYNLISNDILTQKGWDEQ